MAEKKAPSKYVRVSDICAAMEKIAPLGLAQDWDNVGLLAGDPAAVVRRVLVCVDLTAGVVAEVGQRKAQMVVAYHPPLFKPISRLNAASQGTDAHVFACIAKGVAIYSPHTALDAADGGTNDVLAGLCHVKNPAPIEFVDSPGPCECKMVVFVPPAEVDAVAEAMFAAGAGHIGQYSRCGFRLAGQGTFLGSAETNPTVGQAGRFERVDEIRLETVVPEARVAEVVAAMRAKHSYEEPAFDIYPLRRPPAKGMGRCGALDRPVHLGSLAAALKRGLQAECVHMVGDSRTTVSRAICAAGAAGGTVFKTGLREGDVVVTGEMRHHDALTVLRHGACAIVLGHWTSERPALQSAVNRLAASLPGLVAELSTADREPFVAP